MMNNNRKEFMNHLQKVLTSIDSTYTYNINWYADIEKMKTRGGASFKCGKKEAFIVVNPLPSKSFGGSSIVQSLEIAIMCRIDDASDLIDIFSEYQDSVVNKKWWTSDGTLVNESWYSPTATQNFLDYSVEKGATLVMNGSVSFTQDVVDVEKVLIYGQWNKTYEFLKSTVADTLPNSEVNGVRKKAKNRTILTKIDLKCKNSNTLFCQKAREFEESENAINFDVPIKLIYTDGHEKIYNMIFNAVVFSSTDGTIPTISVTLMEKM